MGRMGWLAARAGMGICLAQCALVSPAGAQMRATPKNLMGMLRVEERVAAPPQGGTGSAVDGYTRISVALVPHADRLADRPYDAQMRPALYRAFAGKAIARALTIRTALKRPSVATSHSAVSASYESGARVGETFTSEFSGRRLLTPYFRLDPDSLATVTVELAVTANYKAALSETVLDLIRRATALIAPSSSLISSVNEGRFTEASQFVDQTVSDLLKESLTERGSNDYPMTAWAGRELMRFTVRLPLGNEVTPRSGGPAHDAMVDIGTWVIASDRPILSVFSEAPLTTTVADGACKVAAATDKVACAALADRITPPAVLNFQLDRNVTVAQELAGEPAVVAARDKLVATENEAAKSQARVADVETLCMLVADKAERMGFNRLDASVILWAYTRGGFGSPDATREMRNAGSCPGLARAYGAGLATGSGYDPA